MLNSIIKKVIIFLLIVLLIVLGLFILNRIQKKVQTDRPSVTYDKSKYEIAIFAGGCFWCMVPPFEKLPGVKAVLSGYTGGTVVNPTYEQVSSGSTGHYESVYITYDPTLISYPQLLDVFWKQINPTDGGGQFVDRGDQYRSAIFYENEVQKQIAERSLEQLQNSKIFDKPIVTSIIPFTKFYAAESYHQDYYKKNPLSYEFYRSQSGRDNYLESIWKNGKVTFHTNVISSTDLLKYRKPNDAEIKSKLTTLQYNVTQKADTETPFDNLYWNNEKQGIYVDIVSGEPLYSSTDKFDSGTGWPSFTRPIDDTFIVYKKDNTLFTARTEVRSKIANSHLGHVFNDGPKPTGLRYCMNSAAMRFIPKEDMQKLGYSNFLYLFNK